MTVIFEHTDNTLLGVWKIEESTLQLLSTLEKTDLSPLRKFSSESRCVEWLSVRVLLKELLGYESEISYHPNGAPFLPENIPYNISISHTKGFVAIMLCDKNNPAGIDIEYISGRVKKIRSRFVTDSENSNLDKEHETESLLIHWCAKETMFKMIGCDDVDFLEHLHVKPFAYNGQDLFDVFETRTEKKRSFKLKYVVTPDFVLTHAFYI
jgi:Phosphopantetheinyl transferase